MNSPNSPYLITRKTSRGKKGRWKEDHFPSDTKVLSFQFISFNVLHTTLRFGKRKEKKRRWEDKIERKVDTPNEKPNRNKQIRNKSNFSLNCIYAWVDLPPACC